MRQNLFNCIKMEGVTYDYIPHCKAYTDNKKTNIVVNISVCSLVKKLLSRIFLIIVWSSFLLLTGFLACDKKSNNLAKDQPVGKFCRSSHDTTPYVGSVTVLDKVNPMNHMVYQLKKTLPKLGWLLVAIPPQNAISSWTAYGITPPMLYQKSSFFGKHTFSLDLDGSKFQRGEQSGFILVKNNRSPVDLVKYLLKKCLQSSDQTHVCMDIETEDYSIRPSVIRESVLQCSFDSTVDLNNYSNIYFYLKKGKDYCLIPLENRATQNGIAYSAFFPSANGVSTMMQESQRSCKIREWDSSDNTQKQANEVFCKKSLQSEADENVNQEKDLRKVTPERPYNRVNQHIDRALNQPRMYHSTPIKSSSSTELEPFIMLQNDEINKLRKENLGNVESLAKYFNYKVNNQKHSEYQTLCIPTRFQCNDEPLDQNPVEVPSDTFDHSVSFNNGWSDQANLSIGKEQFIGEDTMKVIEEWDEKRDGIVKSIEKVIKELNCSFFDVSDYIERKKIQTFEPYACDIEWSIKIEKEVIEKIKELEIKKIPLDLSNLYNDLDTIVNRKHEQLGARIYNIAEAFSLLTSKLKPKLHEVLQKLNWLKKELQNLNSGDLLLCGIQERSENLNKILYKSKINQIKEKIEELKSIKNEINQFEIDVRSFSGSCSNLSSGWL